jgi:hypothetical protein
MNKNIKELKKQLLRFDRARTEKTLYDSLSKINHNSVDTEKLSKKEKIVLALIKHTYSIRSVDRWKMLLRKRLKKI